MLRLPELICLYGGISAVGPPPLTLPFRACGAAAPLLLLSIVRFLWVFCVRIGGVVARTRLESRELRLRRAFAWKEDRVEFVGIVAGRKIES
jgi:hypothetical protein